VKALAAVTLCIAALSGCEGVLETGQPAAGGPDAPGGPGMPMVPGMPSPQQPPDPSKPDEPAALPAFAPAELHARLLTTAQYRGSVLALLGPEAAAVAAPPHDVAVNGLAAIGAAQLALSTTAVDAYEQSAFAVAKAALAARKATLIPCTPTKADDAACMGKALEPLLTRAFRRPLEAGELTRWVDLGVLAAQGYTAFDKGVEFALAGILQSPSFLYLDEHGAVDPQDPTRLKLTGYEVASRLSYFILSAPPDDALLAAAASGGLDTADGVRTQARRLTALAAAKDAVAGFFDEALELQELEKVAKDAKAFPDFTPALAASMHEETRRFLTALALEDKDFRDLFTSTTTFVDANLAKHYGLPAVTSWQQVELPAAQGRLGLLGKASVLTMQSHPTSNSPTYRGKFIRERLLCQPIAAPPPDVNTQLPPSTPDKPQTLRQRLQVHMQLASCRGCHAMMDPLGFAFEGFDATGKSRTTDEGLPLDTTGTLDGKGFTGASELSQQLHDDERTMRCLAATLYRQGVGHVELPTEARPLKAATDAFAAGNHRFSQLLVELSASDAFRYGTAPEAQP